MYQEFASVKCMLPCKRIGTGLKVRNVLDAPDAAIRIRIIIKDNDLSNYTPETLLEELGVEVEEAELA